LSARFDDYSSSRSDAMILAVGFSPRIIVATNRRRVATVESMRRYINRRYAPEISSARWMRFQSKNDK
jgi:hypothetical protein